MSKCFYHIGFFIFCFIFSLQANSQDTVVDEPQSVIADTVYETPSNSNYHFKEISVGRNVNTRTIPKKEVERVRSDDDYWYVNMTPEREKKKTEAVKRQSSFFDKPWFKTLFWLVLIGGFIALLIWFLATSNIRLFQRRIKTTAEGNLQEEQGENIFEINFEKEIQKAINVSDYRLAVRLLYLRTLRDLALCNLINYTHEKTNSDYLFQLADSSRYAHFFRLTRHFDYTWYGHFPLSQEGFSVIQNEFNSFKRQLS